MTAPVYLFTGFLDSGKTSLIKDTLNDASFMEGTERTLILCFEDGEEKYDEKFLDAHNTFIEFFDASTELTLERIKELDTIYHPNQVFIEYNGTEAISELLISGMPSYWPLVQILTTVDASTFEMYITAMRSLLFEQLRYSDTIIINRCNEDTSFSMLRGNIKAINRRAQLFYEGMHGEPAKFKDGILPFDINADIIDINNDDYGLWYMDAIESPDKYNEKEVIIRGRYAEDIEGYKQTFILGRRAMVCCAQDTSLCGLTVTGVKIEEMKKDDWIEVQGILKTVPIEDSDQKTLVLYANRVQHTQEPEEEYVYFS